MSTGKTTCLFIFPPYRGDHEFHHHLGVGYIQAYLEEKGIDSLQYVPQRATTPSSLVEEIRELDPEFIGFTCYDSNYYIVKSLAHLIKKKGPETPIVVGGPTATFSDRFILENSPDIDICVRGEGEQTMFELIRENVTNLEGIKGVSFRDSNLIIRTEDRPLSRAAEKDAELDILPSPYLKEIVPLDGQSGILTSRGCIYKCVYCNFSAMSRHTVRYHSIDRVVAELRKIDSYVNTTDRKKQIIQIFDDTFSLNKERAKEICRRIIDERISLNFFVDTRADSCDLELLRLMRKAGVSSINFGLESAVPRVLRNIKKVYAGDDQLSYSPEKRFLRSLKENVELAKELEFRVSVSIIVGLPGETLEDAEETLRFVDNLGVFEYGHNYLNIFPGTELFEIYKQYGYSICESDTILPFRTICPFNVYSPQPCANSNLLSYVQANERAYFEILTNSGLHVTKHLNVLVDSFPETRSFYSWLSKDGTIPFNIFNLAASMTLEKLCRQVSELVEWGAPVGKTFYLEKVLPSRDEGSYKLMGFNQHRQLSTFAEIPLAETEHDLSDKERKTIFTLSMREDIEKLIELVKESMDSEYVTANQPLFDCGIKDECRWSTEPCPAITLQRIIVAQDGSIRACYEGKAVGDVTSPRSKIVAQLKSLYEETRLRRGCDTCIIQDSCSMCLFPTPLKEKEYCSIRRGLPEIGSFVELLILTRILTEKGLLKKSEHKTLSMRLESPDKTPYLATLSGAKIKLRPEIKLVHIDKCPYIVSRKSGTIFRLNPLTATIVGSIISGRSIRDLLRTLQVEFKRDRNEVLDKVNKALVLFKEKGFIQHL